MKKSELIKALQESITKSGDNEDIFIAHIGEWGYTLIKINEVLERDVSTDDGVISNCVILDTTY